MTVGENRLIICVISKNSVIFHKVKLILAANRMNSITDSGADCLGNVTKNLMLKLNESFLSFCGLIRTVHGYVTTRKHRLLRRQNVVLTKRQTRFGHRLLRRGVNTLV